MAPKQKGPDSTSSRGAITRAFGKATKEFLQNARGKEGLYKLPWMALVGEPGSGKELLLPGAKLPAKVGSPNAFGNEGDVEAIDHFWYFSNAFLIDYAANYFALEQEELAEDPDEKKGMFRRKPKNQAETAWKVALDATRRNRPQRPLDGMVLCVDATSLQARTPEQQTELSRRAEAVAERVHEAQHRLGVHFPIYVILTNCEKLQGFEAFAGAAPAALREHMFGWSNPYEPNAEFSGEWVNEALGSMHEAVCSNQLDLMPQLKSQADRDELYLLPRAIMDLRGALRAYLEPVFRSSSYRQGLPLRGIYMTARLDESKFGADDSQNAGYGAPKAPPGAEVKRTPVFVKQIFSEKIFQEPGLTKLDDDLRKKLGKKARLARIILVVFMLIGGLLMFLQARSTAKEVNNFASFLKLLEDYSKLADAPKKGRASSVGTEGGRGVLEELAKLDVDEFEVYTAPTTFIENLTGTTNKGIEALLKHGVGQELAGMLKSRGGTILSENYRNLPDWGEWDDGVAGLQDISLNSPKQHIKALREFTDEVGGFKEARDAFIRHEAADLGKLYVYLYPGQNAEQFGENLESQTGLYQRALQDVDWRLTWDLYRVRARKRMGQLAQRFWKQLFDHNPLLDDIAEVRRGIEALKTGGGKSYYARLKAIDGRLTELDKRIKQAGWIVKDFNPPGYTDLTKVLDSGMFNVSDDEKHTDELIGTSFREQNQQRFRTLKEKLCPAPGSPGDRGMPVLVCTTDALALSDEAKRIQAALKDFFDQDYVFVEDTDFNDNLQRVAAGRKEWTGDLLNRVLDWYQKLTVYTQAEREKLPPFLVDAMVKEARRQWRARAQQIVDQARPATLSERVNSGFSWTDQLKDDLKARTNNLAEQFDAAMKIVEAFGRIDDLLDPSGLRSADNRLFNDIQKDATGLLVQVYSILESEKLYTVRSDQFSWWDSNQPPCAVAFGAKDTDDLTERLRVMRQTITVLAYEFADPLVQKMLAAGITDAEVDQWNEIITVLRAYEKKVPGNSLENLERFVEDDLCKIQLATCQEQLRGKTDRYNADFFKKRKNQIATTMSRRCTDILRKVTIEGYVQMQTYFTEKLQGRFPFAGADTLAEAETGEVVAFYKSYDRYASAFRALLRPGRSGEAFGEDTPEVRRFLEMVERARPVFSGLLSSEDENPDMTMDISFDFRVNRDNEVNGNQIIQWTAIVGEDTIRHRDNKLSTQWRSNDPVTMCFQWAKDATYLPAANQRAEHARINGRRACYGFGGRWALLRMISKHAATPADRGRRSFLRPHTLRFETETSLARSGATRLVDGTRVYNRVAIVLPGGKAAIRLPKLPLRAPELTDEFLKSRGISPQQLQDKDSN